MKRRPGSQISGLFQPDFISGVRKHLRQESQAGLHGTGDENLIRFGPDTALRSKMAGKLPLQGRNT